LCNIFVSCEVKIFLGLAGIKVNPAKPYILTKDKMSQNQAILDYLKTGNTLTGLDGLKLFGTMKLASRISELRDEGIDIKDELIHDLNTGKHYKKYWIEPFNHEPVFMVKEHGQLEFAV
jgi:hypothetical protein